MADKYFVNTGDDIVFVGSQEEAIVAAQRAIDDWRDCCDPEWGDEVEGVFWGKVMGVATATNEQFENPETGCSYVDYELKEPE